MWVAARIPTRRASGGLVDEQEKAHLLSPRLATGADVRAMVELSDLLVRLSYNELEFIVM